MGVKYNTESYILRASEIHGDKFNYEKVDYKGNEIHITIMCKNGHEFHQQPFKHLSGRGCPDCNPYKKLTTETFILKSIEKHGEEFDYSEVEYINSSTPVIIKCEKGHLFQQKPSKHLIGHKCSECNPNKKMTLENFIKKSIEKYGNLYKYDKVIFVDMETPVIIYNDIKGEFLQTPKSHLNTLTKHSIDIINSNSEKFLNRCLDKYGDKFEYFLDTYKDWNNYVKIRCKEHDKIFYQKPKSHLNNIGCSDCFKEKYLNSANGRYRTTLEDFIEKAKEKHGDRYGYDKVIYINKDTKVEIYCKEHDYYFSQTPHSHYKSGCPKCAMKNHSSFPEQALYFYISKLNTDVLSRSKFFNYELDIYLPEFNFSIEYDGSRWHKNSYERDIIKTNLLLKNNINIIRIREKGLLPIDNCINFFRLNHSEKDLTRVLNEVLSYITINYNLEINFVIDFKKDKQLIFENILNNNLENSVEKTHPEILPLWHPTKNGNMLPKHFTFGTHTKAWWKCEKGHEWESRIYYVCRNTNKCPECFKENNKNK